MSNRTDRREAERLARKLAYQLLRGKPAQQPPADVPEASQVSEAISEAQLAANRANAQLSSGPATEAGKEISSRNNFRHGLTQTEGELILLDSENPEDYVRVLKEFQDEWQPKTPTEKDLVERLASRQWLRRRAMKLQTRFLAPDGIIQDEKQFALYRRYEIQHERAYNKAFSDLMRLRSLQLREKNGFESHRRQEELHILKIQALKDRETRNQFAMLESQARYSLAQMRVNQQSSLEIVTESTQQSQEVNLEATEAREFHLCA